MQQSNVLLFELCPGSCCVFQPCILDCPCGALMQVMCHLTGGLIRAFVYRVRVLCEVQRADTWFPCSKCQ